MYKRTSIRFCCRYCIYGDEETKQVVQTELPDNVRTIEVLCTGRIDASHLLTAFELGAAGGFVAGCLVVSFIRKLLFPFPPSRADNCQPWNRVVWQEGTMDIR